MVEILVFVLAISIIAGGVIVLKIWYDQYKEIGFDDVCSCGSDHSSESDCLQDRFYTPYSVEYIRTCLLKAYVKALNKAYQELLKIDNNGDYNSVHNNSLEEILLPLIEEIGDLSEMDNEALEVYSDILSEEVDDEDTNA